ncbi:hypothetical protein PpBr36_05483 [Pyricularia pennisetigena]|uniref:hypothetical protein n=1 Tax=Pyricularia pennisetigena TaxID=1578925 RepID=UPI0011542DB4|nr:hypothetical protein PpBr36_05483 [Pyricularia pennisetigena]TLS27368.1 hypothetical protein PpBr36_05483 [Pyricularia pennisetigena]
MDSQLWRAIQPEIERVLKTETGCHLIPVLAISSVLCHAPLLDGIRDSATAIHRQCRIIYTVATALEIEVVKRHMLAEQNVTVLGTKEALALMTATPTDENTIFVPSEKPATLVTPAILEVSVCTYISRLSHLYPSAWTTVVYITPERLPKGLVQLTTPVQPVVVPFDKLAYFNKSSSTSRMPNIADAARQCLRQGQKVVSFLHPNDWTK